MFEFENIVTNQVLKFKERPFNSKKSKTIYQLYNKALTNTEKRKIFWWKDYSVKLYEERKGIWFHHLWYNTRGDDFTSGFNKNWLQKIKIIEPEIENFIDVILTEVLTDKNLIQEFKEALKK